MSLIIQKLIGQGVYGKVFSVLDTTTQEQYAAKLVVQSICERGGISEAESDILFRIKHPNLVHAIRWMTSDEIAIFNVPEYMIKNKLFSRGILLPLAYNDLDSILVDIENKKVGWELWFNPMIALYQIACGLEALHEMGYYHLDLKPKNILIKDATCQLADYGLSISSSVVDTLHLCVTVNYRPPEFDIKSPTYYITQYVDVFSLGVILAEFTTTGIARYSPKKDDNIEMYDHAYILKNIESINKQCDEWIKWLKKNKNNSEINNLWGGIGQKGMIEICKLIKKCISVVPQNRGTAKDFRLVLEKYIPSTTTHYVHPVYILSKPIESVDIDMFIMIRDICLTPIIIDQQCPVRVIFCAFHLYCMLNLDKGNIEQQKMLAVACITIAADIHGFVYYHANLYKFINSPKIIGFTYELFMNYLCTYRISVETNEDVDSMYNPYNFYDTLSDIQAVKNAIKNPDIVIKAYKETKGQFMYEYRTEPLRLLIENI